MCICPTALVKFNATLFVSLFLIINLWESIRDVYELNQSTTEELTEFMPHVTNATVSILAIILSAFGLIGIRRKKVAYMQWFLFSVVMLLLVKIFINVLVITENNQTNETEINAITKFNWDIVLGVLAIFNTTIYCLRTQDATEE